MKSEDIVAVIQIFML